MERSKWLQKQMAAYRAQNRGAQEGQGQDQGCPEVCLHARTGGGWELTQPTAFSEGSSAPRMFLSDTENNILDGTLNICRHNS